MKVTLTHFTHDPVEAIEEAASNCYNSQPSNGRIMRACYNSGHHAVLEFADFTFHIEGISRALSHQLVRHRLASYAQRSQRYCSENGFYYVTPSTITKNEEALNKYNNFMNNCEELYAELQSLGIPNEDARFVLPNACETQIEVKMNFRELIHFMNERLCTRAQWEIRKLAEEMRREVIAIFPELKPYLVPKCESYAVAPYCTEHNSCGRHPKLKDIYTIYEKAKLDANT